LEHRIIAAMVGIPTDERIDHKDGCGTNNHPSNLRRATQRQNSMNTDGWSRKDLRVGVHRVKSGKFAASCRVSGRQKHLGTYATYEEACAARASAEREHYAGFSAAESRNRQLEAA
jgi:hypothetical protein